MNVPAATTFHFFRRHSNGNGRFVHERAISNAITERYRGPDMSSTGEPHVVCIISQRLERERRFRRNGSTMDSTAVSVTEGIFSAANVWLSRRGKRRRVQNRVGIGVTQGLPHPQSANKGSLINAILFALLCHA